MRFSRTIPIFASAFCALSAPVFAAPERSTEPRTKAQSTATDSASIARERRTLLAPVKSWTVQLRYLDLAAVAAAPVDLIVIDHARHPKQISEVSYTSSEILPLKSQPDGKRRIVLSYLSMGEAEQYRYYWNKEWNNLESRPSWIGQENEQWPGNFLVNYADPEWQTIIFGTPESYLDRIISAGFDGVYLDRADAFEDGDGATPAKEDAMVSYIKRLADHARRLNPRFLIVMQNAESLLRDRSLRTKLDGTAKEDLLFGVDHSETANPKEMVREGLNYLRVGKRAGLKVFLLEYVKSPDSIRKLRTLARRENFLLHLSERRLDALTLDETGEPQPSTSGTP
ncbi:MAG: MJ1477/TM1410 family putative glycoside hydrolase [Burkholderiales bacterium]